MSNDDDNAHLSEKKYTEVYTDNMISCVNTISRSYSSGINAPSISSNRLRVYSTDSKCPGPLRVRSSPTSPNRLSRFQCMTMVRRKWSGAIRINQSSSSEFDSYPTSCNSNKSLHCDQNIDQFDLSWKHDSSTYSSTSCQNLQAKGLSLQNQDDFYPPFSDLQTTLSGCSTTNLSMRQIEGSDDIKVKRCSQSSHGPTNKESLTLTVKSPSNPINFKKALRDRYLNSQKSTFTSTSSSQHKNRPMSFTDDCLFLTEGEDHNFHFTQAGDIKKISDFDSDMSTSMDNAPIKKSLSIDLKNLSALKKYRIQSNNSTISSMSEIETEGDPFSPASTEISSPFLKLKLPYRTIHRDISESGSPSLTSSPSLGTLQSTYKTQNCSPNKKFELLSTRTFFPESMKLSDFYTNSSLRNDCAPDTLVERLLRPGVDESHTSSKSAPQSLQLSPNCTNLLSDPETPVTCATTGSAQSLSHPSIVNSEEEDAYIMRPITSSKSMDYLDSFYLDVENCKSLKENKDDWANKSESQNRKCDSNRTPNVHRKTKHAINMNQLSKKSISIASTSNQRQCPICGRHFNRSDMLARHSRVHTGHKPFECSICGQSFSRSDHLNTHMRIHSGEKPYQCSLCSYSACRRDMITRHLRVHRRKGDVAMESISVLVVNTQRSTATVPTRSLVSRSQNSLTTDSETVADECDLLPLLHRCHSASDSKQGCTGIDVHRSALPAQTTEQSRVIPKTFANISISICQPTPRSSFSMPMESLND